MVFACCAAPDVQKRRAPLRAGPASNDRFGAWQLEGVLGKGRAEVRAARNSVTGATAAVKIVPRRPGAAEARVMRHVTAHAHTEHVVALLDTVDSAGATALVMEKATGVTLREVIEAHGSLDEETARWVFDGVVAAMRDLQRVGVAHRDIKPDNIMVDLAQRRVTLIDFDLARMHGRGFGDAELSSDVAGTKQYIAPEVWGKAYNAFVSDAFSLGVSLYVASTGRFPRLAAERPGEDGRGCAFHHDAFSTLSLHLQGLLLELTAYAPEERLPLDDVICHPWFMMSPHGSSSAASSHSQ